MTIITHTYQGPHLAVPIVLFHGDLEEWQAQNLTAAQIAEEMRRRRQGYGPCCGKAGEAPGG